MTLVIDPKVALLKGVDPVQFCVFFSFSVGHERTEKTPGSCTETESGRRMRNRTQFIIRGMSTEITRSTWVMSSFRKHRAGLSHIRYSVLSTA